MKARSTKKQTSVKAEVKENSFPIVAIGASAGGLEAMMELLKYLPADTGMAYIFVQHLSPDHKSMLTEILSKKTPMKVQEIDDMDKIRPDHVFVIPCNKGIEVTDGHIKLIPRSKKNVAVSIDILFSSLAEAQKERVIGIILSGSASDGAMGMKSIKEGGGLTFAQDDTARFTSMPHAAISTGVVDLVLSPKEIALELVKLSKHPLIKAISVKTGEEDLLENGDPDLKIILAQLYKTTNVDFGVYKMNTIKRRIIRRMVLYKITNLKAYAKLLSQKREEIGILYQDLLINVTSFFRDVDTHKYLKENLFPKLLKRKKSGELVRIWIPACATGEEAYSMAMMFLEIYGSKTKGPPVQIFATDLSEQAISKARNGIYTKQELGTLSPKRIQRFFTRSNGDFRINKAVREMCVFAPHNILQDPPFSRLDFISCCNLFIYLDNPAQKKAVNTFHYALNEDGFLMLGRSENITQSGNLFKDFNKKYKIFARKTNSGSRTMPALLPRYSKQNIPIANKNKTNQNISFNNNELSSAIDALLVSEFMPASVVINHQMEIVQFRGATELYLTHPQGNATLNILKMARPELAFELRNSISKVIKTKHRLHKSGIELKINSLVKIVSLDIVPLEMAPLTIAVDEPLLLVLFTEQEQTEIFVRQAEGGKNTSIAKDRRIKKLEQEIAAAHADALALAEEQEAFTEELQSANEEIVSSNEELQTVNEELETAKEETESTNEELSITNQELQTRNDQLNESYEFSEAIIATMPSPMVVLDKNLRVKSASKTFYKKFKVTEEETEGVLLYDLGNRQWNIPRLRELLEEILPKNSSFHDYEISHTFPFVGEKIMLLNASRIVHKTSHEELILLAFADLTEVRKLVLEKEAAKKKVLEKELETEKKLKEISEEKQKQLQNLFNHSPFSLTFMEGENFVYKYVNEKAAEILGAPVNEVIGKSLFEILPEIKAQVFKEKLTEVLKTGKPFVGKEVPASFKRGDELVHAYFDFVYEPFYDSAGKTTGVVSSAIDVTEKVLARKKIEETEKQLQNIFLNAPAAISILEGREYKFVLANKAYEKLTNRKAEDLLGKNMIDVFPELEAGTLELFDNIFETGESFSLPEHALMLDLKNEGVLRQCYFNFSMEPLKNDSGEIYALITISYDITEQVEAGKKIKETEKQEAFLLKLSDAIKELIDPVDIQLTACRILGEHVKVNRVLYGEVIDEEQITISNNYVNGVAPIIASLDAEQFGRNVIDAFKRNEKVIISDITTDPGYTEEEKQSFLALDVVANAGMGLVKGGRWVATFGMHYNAPRKWTATEIWLLEETAERTWAAVERARAEKALRKSEEKYRTLFTSIDQGFAFCELIRNKEGKGIDFYVLEVNSTYEKQAGVSAEMVVGKSILQVFPTLDKWWIETYAAVVDNQRPVVFEQYSEPSQRWLAINAYPGEKDRFAILFSDITERKRREANLEFLAGINLDFAPLLTAQEVMNYVSEKLANHLHLSRCLFSTVDEEQDRMEVIYDFRSDEKFASVMGVRLISDNLTEEGRRHYGAGKLVVMNAVADSPLVKTPAHVLKELGFGSVVTVPHLEAGRWKFTVTIVRAELSEWRSDEIELVQELTSRIYIRIDRARAEEALLKSEERLSLAIQASDIYWWEFDFNANATLFASNAEQVIGAAPAKTMEENLLLLHSDDRKLVAQAFEEAIKSGSNHFNYAVRSIAVPSEVRWLQVSGRIICDYQNKPAFAIGITQNITERKKAENIQNEFFEKLETQVQHRTQELLKVNEELSQFAHVTSHDLQEPLRKLENFISCLIDEEKETLSESGKHYLERANQTARRMQSLVDDLLVFSRTKKGDLKFERTNLNSILNQVKDDLKEAIQETGAVINAQELSEINIIPFQVRQLLNNLVGNSLKFSREGINPQIVIKSEVAKGNKFNKYLLKDHPEKLQPETAYCYISISDNGIGFDYEYKERIFEVFQRLHGQEQYKGTGIGLAICKKIVTNHNGIITATGKVNEGATFDIYLPAE